MRLRTAKDVGALVRDRRHEAGLTQEQLASRCGVSRRWVAAVETGKPTAQLELVMRALGVLGMELQTVQSRPHVSLDLDAALERLDQDQG